jgi:NAD(P)-dependent dehydrogenase (short-subunit alcohol dehydrogenase family)
MKLEGQAAIITGGGRGIGREIALRYAAEGAAISISGTTESALQSVVEELTAAGARALATNADVADEPSVEHLVSRTLAEFGRIDILVNNAGIIGPTAPVPQVKTHEWQRTLDVNLTGAFLCAKHALPSMIERGSGRIINITSVAGLMGYALRSPYSVSKWGMIGLTRTLADEVGRYNITVNAIAPGPVHGARMDEVIRRRAAEMGRSIDEVTQEYVGRSSLKRMVDERDVAALALFLASAEGANISGETIKVAAGFSV